MTSCTTQLPAGAGCASPRLRTGNRFWCPRQHEPIWLTGCRNTDNHVRCRYNEDITDGTAAVTSLANCSVKRRCVGHEHLVPGQQVQHTYPLAMGMTPPALSAIQCSISCVDGGANTSLRRRWWFIFFPAAIVFLLTAVVGEDTSKWSGAAAGCPHTCSGPTSSKACRLALAVHKLVRSSCQVLGRLLPQMVARLMVSLLTARCPATS